MKKTLAAIVAGGILTLAMTVSSLAAGWQSDAVGWWWQNDDGSYPKNCWQWIDGNGDGTAESYYFNEAGYLLVSTVTPDGYTVDANGAWTVNGIVQTQKMAGGIAQTSTSATGTDTAAAGTDMPQDTEKPYTSAVNNNSGGGTVILQPTDTVWLSASGSKYHRIPNCGNMNPDTARAITYEEALRHGYDACDNCF